jgi:hypothetical protein
MPVPALSALAASLGLAGVFFVLFPVIVQGLIAFAVAEAIGEKVENDRYAATHRVPGASRTPVE